MVCHAVTDALSYLHATSLLQDRDWRENPVPVPANKLLSTWQVFTKWFELMGILASWKKK